MRKVPYYYGTANGHLGQYDFENRTFILAEYGRMFTSNLGNFQVAYDDLVGSQGSVSFLRSVHGLPVAGSEAQNFVEENPDRHITALIVCKPYGAEQYPGLIPLLKMKAFYFVVTTVGGQVLGIYATADASK